MGQEEKNVDDVLALLTNMVENTKSIEDENEEGPSEQLSNEDIRKKLLEQIDSRLDDSSESSHDEYAIDESFMAEAVADEAEEAEEKEDSEVNENTENTVELGETEESDGSEEAESEEAAEESVDADEENILDAEKIEIVIPWVENIPEGSFSEDELESVDDEEDAEDVDSDSAEDDFSGGFVRFADDFGGDDDDMDDEVDALELDISEMSNEEAHIFFGDGIVSETDDGDEEIEETEDNTEDVDNGEEQNEQVRVESDTAESDEADDDDLPWYDDGETPSLSVTPTPAYDNGERPFFADTFSDTDENGQLDVQDITESIEEDEEDDPVEESVEELAETEEEAEEEQFEIFSADEEDVDEDSSDPEGLFEDDSDNESAEISEDEADDDDESLYRTIIEAREKTDEQYAHSLELADDEKEDELVENVLGEQDDESDARDGDSFDENTPEVISYTSPEGEEENGLNGEDHADFYGLGEHDADPDEDRQFSEEGLEGELEFEEETEEAEEKKSFFENKAVWKILKLVLSPILAAAIIVLELIPLFGIELNGLLDYTTYAWSYILIDTQLLVFLSALFYDKLLDGMMRIFGGRVNFYSIISMTLIINFLHSIIACFCADEMMPNLYNSISAIYIIALYFLERIDRKREQKSLELLSGAGGVFTLKRSYGKNSCAEKMYLGGVDPDTNIFEPAEIVSDDLSGAFKQDMQQLETGKRFADNIVMYSLTPIAVAAIFMTVLSIVFEYGLAVSVNTFVGTFVLLAPLSSIFAYYLPVFVSYLRLKKRGCVIAGYDAAAEISACDAMVFSDKHLFCESDAKKVGIKLYCSSDKTRKLFVCLAAAYSSLGGPMEKTFAPMLGTEKHNVNMIRITRSGFEALIDSRTNLIVGGSEYLMRYGIITDKEDANNKGILYVAMDTVLCAKISVAYRTQPLFEVLCELLSDNGIRTVVQTYDPVISGKYIVKCRESEGIDEAPAVSVVHKNVNDYNTPEKAKALGRSGAFAKASRLKLIELAVFCKRLVGIRKINSAIVIASYAVSAALGLVLTISGAIEHVNLLWVLLYHAALVAAYAITAIKYLPLSFEDMQAQKERKEMRKQEKENKFNSQNEQN